MIPREEKNKLNKNENSNGHLLGCLHKNSPATKQSYYYYYYYYYYYNTLSEVAASSAAMTVGELLPRVFILPVV